MKCPNCGLEMIDIKDYCGRCGKKLKKEEKNISLGKLLIIFFGLIVFTLSVCYMIINYNTKEEIKPYLNETTEK